MTPVEYHLWASAFGEPRTPRQLDRMRRMLSEVDFAGKPMDEKKFKDIYWAPYNHVLDNDGNTVLREFPSSYDSTMWFSLLGKLDKETIS